MWFKIDFYVSRCCLIVDLEEAKMDYSKFGDLETYVFKGVKDEFEKNGFLNAFDFFSVIIWKSNRSKTKIKDKLIDIAESKDLNKICKKLTGEINEQKDKKERLKLLLEDWKFGLPMASAILTVLDRKNEFTVYDIRVCNALDAFKTLNGKGTKNKIKGYFEYVEKVKEEAKKNNKTLRKMDKLLWYKSFCKELEQDVKNNFKRLEKQIKK
jgi:hypothetical protein